MKTILRGITAVLGVVLASAWLAPAASAGGNATAGKDKIAVCSGCHSADGNSAVPNFPKLAGLGEKYLLKQMRDINSANPAKSGRVIPEMTGMLAGLSEQDMADIAAYYSAQKRQLAGATDNAKQLSLGERIFRAGNLETGVPACTGCHSPSGNGNTPAGYPALGGQHAAYVAKQLRAFRTGAHDAENPSARLNDESGVMRGVAAHLNDQEVDALSNYISGLH
ncbi:MAG: c-type cytochrome [Porticoccaceae bacterium]